MSVEFILASNPLRVQGGQAIGPDSLVYRVWAMLTGGSLTGGVS
jgi:hypothetical protein